MSHKQNNSGIKTGRAHVNLPLTAAEKQILDGVCFSA